MDKQFTLKQLREVCGKRRHGLAAYYSGGELFVNKKDGTTVYNKYMDWDLAQELCEELNLSLRDV